MRWSMHQIIDAVEEVTQTDRSQWRGRLTRRANQDALDMAAGLALTKTTASENEIANTLGVSRSTLNAARQRWRVGWSAIGREIASTTVADHIQNQRNQT